MADMSNIREIADGQYEVRISYVEELTGKRRRVKRRVEGLEEALRLRERMKAQALLGLLETRQQEEVEKPLRDWLPEYLQARQRRVAFSTFAIEENVFNSYIIDQVGSWKPSKIDLQAVDSIVRVWTTLEGSMTTHRNRRGMLIRFLRWTLKRVGKNPAFLREVEPIKPKKGGRQVGRALSKEDARRFLEVTKEGWPHHFAIVFTLLVTGQRWGSVSALRWSDLDLDRKTITFATSHYRGEVKEGNKSGKVIRIPLPPELEQVLEHHRKRMIEEQHPNLKTGLIFPSFAEADESPCKGYQNAGDLRGFFDSACKKAGIKRITPHDLRRTFNSWTVDQGIDGTIIRSITGHSSESMTDHYYRGSQEAKGQALRLVIESAMGDQV